jgi:hypothetical protein
MNYENPEVKWSEEDLYERAQQQPVKMR